MEKSKNKDVDPKNEKKEKKEIITLSEINYMIKHLKDLGIGKETPVMCYDSSDGKRAARLACLVSSIGIKYVTILDRRIVEDPKSEINVTNARQDGVKNFDFASKLDYFA
jgi:3-mercaptopyruvate sulfurtransferase SseA